MTKRKVNPMNKITIGLIGCGNVGSGFVKFLTKHRSHFRDKYKTDFILKKACDLAIRKADFKHHQSVVLTHDYKDVIKDKDIDVVVELIGGLHPAREIVLGALRHGKHVITANKWLIANDGKKLFQTAHQVDKNIYFESCVMAGVPSIKTITEGVCGNQFQGIYGIINGTCNYILSAMALKKYTFAQALKEAQQKGFAESNPTLDINGTDSNHKLAILIALAFGKFVKLEDIYTEGISHISHLDIEHAESMNFTIKLLAIAKRQGNEIEARVHPTLISKDHPLASINGIYNAISLDTDPLGDILLSGEGAGQMAAASGVISDLINLTSRNGSEASRYIGNLYQENESIKVKKIDQISTKFYIRFMAIDKPGVLSKISGILAHHGISINSVTQKVHNPSSTVPVVMLTDYAREKRLRLALEKIHKLPIVKSKPVAIRMENLKLIFK